MAYDKSIDERIRNYTATRGIETKNMFGGICYLSNGNMMCGFCNDALRPLLDSAREFVSKLPPK